MTSACMIEPPNTANRKMTRLALLAVVAVLLLTLHFYSPLRSGLWAQTFFDALHVPVFGLIALSLYAITPGHHRRVYRIAISLAVTCVLSVLSEAAQIPVGRDASLHDLIADWLGAAGFLTAAVAVSPGFSISLVRRFAIGFVAVALLGWPLYPLANVSAAYLERNAQFPILVQFDSKFGAVLIRKQNVTLQISDQPGSGHKFAHVTVGAGPWPGVAFHDLSPDWRGYSTLIIDVEIGEDDPLEINVRVHDQAHKSYDNAYTDRYSKTFVLEPGRHTLQIPLEDIRQAPRDREMDLSEIEEIIVFSRASNSGRTIQLYEIRLQ